MQPKKIDRGVNKCCICCSYTGASNNGTHFFLFQEMESVSRFFVCLCGNKGDINENLCKSIE